MRIREHHARPEVTDAHGVPAALPESGLQLMARATAQQHQAILELRELFARRGGQIEEFFLTAEKPERTIKDISSDCRGFAVVNFSTITIQVGFGGRSALAGSGFPVPAQSYIQVPTETNLVILAATLAELEGVSQAMVAFIKYRHLVNLAAGPLNSSAASQAREAASAVTGKSPRSVEVGVVSAAVIAANSERKGLEIQNTGIEAISLGLGAAAVIGDDIVLEPKASWNGTISGVLWRGYVDAIAPGPGNHLAVVEV